MPDFLIQLHEYVMDADRVPFLVASIVVTFVCGLVTGPLAGNANPLFWLFYDVFLGRLGDRMDKTSRPRADLIMRGFILTVFALFFALMLGRILRRFSVHYALLEVILISLCLAGGAAWYLLLKLYFTLEKGQPVKGVYYGLSRSTRTNLNSTDTHGLVREAISYGAISLDKGLIAPSLWYLIGGLPVLLVYTTVSALAWRFGKCGFTKGFGLVPLALEKLMGFVPSMFTGMLLSAASALTPGASIGRALAQWWAARGAVAYEQGGPVLSAVSWPLNISIGGPVQDLSGSALRKSWVGPAGASAKIEHGQLKRAIYTYVMAVLVFVLALLAAYVYAGHAGF